MVGVYKNREALTFMNKIFRFLQISVCAVSLCFASLSPVCVIAEEECPYGEIDGDPIVSLTDLDVSRVTSAETEAGSTDVLTPAEEIDMITLIVELEEPGVLEAGLTAGSKEGNAYAAKLIDSQNTLGTAVKQSAGQTMALKPVRNRISVINHYTNVINAMSVRIPKGMEKRIQNMQGVKRVFRPVTYSRPKTFEAEDSYEPEIHDAAELIGAGASYTGEFSGEGMVIGVMDTGLDLTHSAFSTMPQNQKIKEKNAIACPNASDTYKNAKVPFAYDYADHDTDVIPAHGDSAGSHGTHVAGICAGNDDVITGIAPDAQIAVFKVFPDEDEDTNDEVLLRALEDAAVVKPDVLNMSLGDAGGDDGTLQYEDFYEESTALAEVYKRLADSGILVSAAAGNSGYPGYTFGHFTGRAPAHRGLTDQPGSYDSAITTGSVHNTSITYSMLLAGGVYEEIYFNDPARGTEKQFSLLADPSMPDYEDCGYGRTRDFTGTDVQGKIALVSYGVIPVSQKQANAARAGAAGLIVYNNQKGSIPNLVIDSDSIPVISISMESGEKMKSRESKEITRFNEFTSDYSEYGRVPSTFSSWGTTDTLNIKPEIMAVGESVYSAVVGGYGSMGGTSMATPVTSGALALVKAYVLDAKLAETEKEANDLAVRLLMSTAHPYFDEETGFYESPRHQGAGLINVSDAMTSHAYLSVEGTCGNRPKLELGDDPSFTGSWDCSFTATNISDFDQVYDIESVMGTLVATGREYIETAIGFECEGPKQITVPAHSEEEARITLSLTEEGKEVILNEHDYGGFAEGYIFLNPVEGSEDSTKLSIPFVGYLGDFDSHPILDATALNGYEALRGINTPVTFDAYMDMLDSKADSSYYMVAVPGYSPVENYSYLNYYHNIPADYIAVSSETLPEFEGQISAIKVLDRRKHSGVWSASLALLKGITQAEITIIDAISGEIYSGTEFNGWYRKGPSQLEEDYWNRFLLNWAGGDASGNPLPEGAKVNMVITVSCNGGKTEDSVSIPISIDNTRPYIAGEKPSGYDRPASGTSAKLAVTASGKKYLKFEANDNQFLAGAQVGTQIRTVEYSTRTDTGLEDVPDIHYKGLELVNSLYDLKSPQTSRSFAPKEKGEAQLINFDVTGYNTGTYCIALTDYAGNQSFYELTPAQSAGLSFRLDPEEITIDAPGIMQMIGYKVYDNDGFEIDGSSLSWKIEGSGTGTIVNASTQTVVVTRTETSRLLTLTVSDPADPAIQAKATIRIRYPGDPDFIIDPRSASIKAGETLQLKTIAVPAEGTKITWSSSDESVLKVSENGEVKALKVGKAAITAETDSGETDTSEITVLFTDVADESKYYFKPVYWAAENGITNGYRDEDGISRTFGPEKTCTREAVVTFLWRLAGRPEPKNLKSPFSDLQNPNVYYYKPVLWAAEQQITKGYSDGTFRPHETCLREHVVTFLYRFAGEPSYHPTVNPFNDINNTDYYYLPAVWANKNGIANGYSSGEHAGGFGPKLDCLREHVVTFLYRYDQKFNQ